MGPASHVARDALGTSRYLSASSPHTFSSPETIPSSARVGGKGGRARSSKYGEHVSRLSEARRYGVFYNTYMRAGRAFREGESCCQDGKDLDPKVGPCRLAFAFANSVWDLAVVFFDCDWTRLSW